MDPRDGADEVGIAHVRQRAEMCLVSAFFADLAPGFDPLMYLPLFSGLVKVVPRTLEVLKGRFLSSYQGGLFVAFWWYGY